MNATCLKIYLVKKNPNHEIGLLNELKADFLITFDPQMGDEIAARFNIDSNKSQIGVCPISIDSRHDQHYWKITSVLGRPVYLGEDGAEAAFGNPVLAEYALQVYLYSLGYSDRPYYKPVNAEFLGTDADDLPIPEREAIAIPKDVPSLKENMLLALRDEWILKDDRDEDEENSERVKLLEKVISFLQESK